MAAGVAGAETAPVSDLGFRRSRRRSAAMTPRQSVYEWIALAMVAAGAIVGPWLFGGVRTWSTGSLLVLTFSGGVLFGLRPLFFRTAAYPVFPAAIPIFILFAGYVFAGVSLADSRYDALLDAIRVAGLLVAFWVWADLTGGHHGRWRFVLSVLLICASLMSLYALIQDHRGSRMVLNLVRPPVYEMRASGAFMCPNHFASYIGMLLPVAVAILVTRDAGHVTRIFSAYALVVIPPALYLTQSRSGWLGALLGVVVTAVLLAARHSWRRFWMTMFLAPLAAAVLAGSVWSFSPMVRHRVANAFQGNERIQVWKDTLTMIGASPVRGHGPGSFRWVYPQFQQRLTAFIDPEHTHNETLEAISDYGFAGFALLATGCAVALGTLLARLRSATRGKDAALIAGTCGAGAAVFVHSCFDYNMHVFGDASVLVMIAGVTTSGLFASGAIVHREWCGRKVRVAAGLITAMLCLVLAFLMARGVGSYLLARWGDEARMQMNRSAAQSYYEKAIVIDPRNPQPYVGYGHLLRTSSSWSFDAAAKKEDAAKAESLYRTALALNPRQLDVEVSLALLYNATGDSGRALSALRVAVEKAPQHRDNLCRLGLQLKQMGRRAEALEIFQRAQRLGSTEMIGLNLRDLQDASPQR